MNVSDQPRFDRRPNTDDTLFLGNVGAYDCWLLYPGTNVQTAWVAEAETYWVCASLGREPDYHPDWVPDEVAAIYNNYVTAVLALKR